jgi:polysaccharide pyruvyl transferase WcaK-like protein
VRTIDEIMKHEPEGMDCLRLADRVIVNGEGTFHHNQRTALAALALARIAEALGKEVHIVNATIQAMHPEVLRLVLGSARRVVVREMRSQKYLQSLDIPCSLGADCAFAANFSTSQSLLRLPEGVDPDHACLVSGGCGLRSHSVLSIVEALRSAGYSPFYFWIGDGDALNPCQCQLAGLPMVSDDMLPWDALPGYLRRVRLVVSGRHHMLIFALLARVPFIPLASNTWKIEGLCELFGWPTPVLAGERGFSKVLSVVPSMRSEMNAVFDRVDRESRKLAEQNTAQGFFSFHESAR